MPNRNSRGEFTQKRSTNRSSRKRNDGLAARTGRTVRDRPYASAAIAAGAASIVAGIAGLFALKRSSGKNWSEFGEDLSTRATDTITDAAAKVKDATASFGDKFTGDELHSERSQSEIMEEALTLKQTGEQPRGPIAEQDIKAGIATSNHDAKLGAKAFN